MEGLPNFPLLLQQIENYLEKAPRGSQQELEAARAALNTIVEIFYAGIAAARCGAGPVLVPDGFKRP